MQKLIFRTEIVLFVFILFFILLRLSCVHTVEYPYFSESVPLLYSALIEFLLLSIETLAKFKLDT